MKLLFAKKLLPRAALLFLMLSLLSSIVVLDGCKESDSPETSASALKITSIVADGTKVTDGTTASVDLNGSTSATGVPSSPTIKITFSKDVKSSSITSSSVFLTLEGTAITASPTTSGAVVTLTPSAALTFGTTYTLSLKSSIEGSDGGSFVAVDRSFTVEGITPVIPPQQNQQLHYWSFNGNTNDADGTPALYQSPTGVSYVTNRHGEVNAAIHLDGTPEPIDDNKGTGAIVELSKTNIIAPSFSYSIWYQVAGEEAFNTVVFGVAANQGYALTFEREGGVTPAIKAFTYHKMAEGSENPNPGATAWGVVQEGGAAGGQVLFQKPISDMKGLVTGAGWHHIVLTFDATTSLKTLYFDGEKIFQKDLDLDQDLDNADHYPLKEMLLSTGEGVGQTLALGWMSARDHKGAEAWSYYETSGTTFKGDIDDFRLFSTALTEAEATKLYNDEKAK